MSEVFLNATVIIMAIMVLTAVYFVKRDWFSGAFVLTLAVGAWALGFYTISGTIGALMDVVGHPDFAPLFVLFYAVTPLMVGIIMFGVAAIAAITNDPELYGNQLQGPLVVHPNRYKPTDYDANKTESTNPTYPKSTFGFFTPIQDGQVKVLVLAASFYDAIMLSPGYTFRYLIDDSLAWNDERRWDIIEHEGRHPDAHPITPYDWWSWKTFVFGPYRVTWHYWQIYAYRSFGLVFTGFWPIIRLRVYPLEYFIERKNTSGKFMLDRRSNFSDHYRVMDFQFFVPMDSIDTSNLIPVRMVVSLIMRTQNVYRAAFKSDDNWSARLFARIPSVINEVVNTMRVQDVVSRSEEVKTNLTHDLWSVIEPLADAEEDGPVHHIGFGFVGKSPLTLPDRSVARQEDEIKLGEVARAQIDKEAQIERGSGTATALQKLSEVAGTSPENLEVARIDAGVRAARETGQAGGFVVLNQGGGSNTDPTFAAILAELRKLTERK